MHIFQELVFACIGVFLFLLLFLLGVEDHIWSKPQQAYKINIKIKSTLDNDHQIAKILQKRYDLVESKEGLHSGNIW